MTLTRLRLACATHMSRVLGLRVVSPWHTQKKHVCEGGLGRGARNDRVAASVHHDSVAANLVVGASCAFFAASCAFFAAWALFAASARRIGVRRFRHGFSRSRVTVRVARDSEPRTRLPLRDPNTGHAIALKAVVVVRSHQRQSWSRSRTRDSLGWSRRQRQSRSIVYTSVSRGRALAPVGVVVAR